MATLIIVLAIIAGVLHLAHNYLPMEVPTDASGGPPVGAPPPGAGGGGGLMDLIGPYLTQIFVLNFVAFVLLALLLFVATRRHSPWRAGIDVLLVMLCAVTLYAWNALGRSNPSGTGTMALIVEVALIALALIDALRIGFRDRVGHTSGI